MSTAEYPTPMSLLCRRLCSSAQTAVTKRQSRWHERQTFISSSFEGLVQWWLGLVTALFLGRSWLPSYFLLCLTW